MSILDVIIDFCFDAYENTEKKLQKRKEEKVATRAALRAEKERKREATRAEKERRKNEEWAKKKGYGNERKSIDWDWDKVLLTFINSAKIVKVGTHTVTFKLGKNEYEVWISNKYYSYGHPYNSGIRNEAYIMPSAYTQYLLEKRLDKELKRDVVSLREVMEYQFENKQ